MTNSALPPAENESPVTPPDNIAQPPASSPPPAAPVENTPVNGAADDLGPRLERLGGEPAPDITPEEFARLQQAGQIHIDPRGRVRTTQHSESDPGIALRKRRAWYV